MRRQATGRRPPVRASSARVGFVARPPWPDTRRVRRRIAPFAALLALTLTAVPAHAQGLQIPRAPASFTKPPPGFRLSGAQAVKVATGAKKARNERARPSPLPLTARPLI